MANDLPDNQKKEWPLHLATTGVESIRLLKFRAMTVVLTQA
jgi:hypothetical protein